jgi:hypothetical protein
MVLCRRLNLFTDAIVAIDGTKFKAVNNHDKNFTPRSSYSYDRTMARMAGSIVLSRRQCAQVSQWPGSASSSGQPAASSFALRGLYHLENSDVRRRARSDCGHEVTMGFARLSYFVGLVFVGAVIAGAHEERLHMPTLLQWASVGIGDLDV